MLSWLSRFKKVETKKLIVIDIGYNSYQLSKALLAIGGYQIVAYIDEEPWNHLSLMNEVKIHYPSELLALAEKNGVDGVLKFEDEGWQPDEGYLAELAHLNIGYIALQKDQCIDEQINSVVQGLSSIG